MIFLSPQKIFVVSITSEKTERQNTFQLKEYNIIEQIIIMNIHKRINVPQTSIT